MASKEPTGARRCPICGAETETAYRPFCSARCRDIDLARWLGGGYAIPGGQETDEDGAEAETPAAGGGDALRKDDDVA
jgi:endogenous inhibitor of DNA gyrase (YacG/DUF329 family)